MLSKDTIKMINIIKKYDPKINIPKITNNKYFMQLYNDIVHIHNNNNEINNQYKYIHLKELNHEPDKYFQDNNFTSENIKTYILTKLIYGYEFNNNNNTIIYFSKRKISSGKIPKIIIHMFHIIKLLKILFNRDDNKNKQHVIYFETHEKKKFPKKNIALGPNEVNSGLTFVDLHKNGNIILYRKEELLKVLIHELIHSNLIDEKIIFSNQNKQFSDLFCVNYRILLNEAFTESFATIINLFYIHIINKLKKSDLDRMFMMEMKYSIYICSKIMKYYNIKNISDVVKNNDICINKFPQQTNVFAYYILKNILLTKHMDFSNILNKYTIHYKIKNEDGVNMIIKLIIANIYILDNNIIYHNDKNNSLRLCFYDLFRKNIP